MPQSQFQPIFDYIDEKIGKLQEDIPSKADSQKLQNSVDGLAKRFDTIEQESKITKARAQRIEHWVMQAAEKTQIPYKP